MGSRSKYGRIQPFRAGYRRLSDHIYRYRCGSSGIELPGMQEITNKKHTANPSPAIGWANSERQSFFQRAPADLLLALALIHHIAISNNVPLQDIAQTCASLGNNLIIEFVPKEDNQVKKLLASRDDIFHDYSNEGFLQAFMQYFTLQKQIPIPETYRTIYWFSKN